MDTKSNELFEINIRSLVKDVLKNLPLIFMIAALVGMGAYLLAERSYQPLYTTNVTYAVTTKGSASTTYANLSTTKQMAEVLSQIMTSDVLKEKVAEDIHLKNVPGTIEAKALPEVNIINIKVTSSSPRMTFLIMQSVMQRYPEVSDYVIGNAVMDLLEAPSIPSYPSNSFTGRRTMKRAFIVSFAALLLLCCVLSYYKDTIKTEADIERKLDAKLFASIPKEKQSRGMRKKKGKKSILISNMDTSFYFVERIKALKAKIEYESRHHGYKIYAVSSLMENEGKSTVAANLALALAQSKKKVLLLDADLRKPAIYKVFDRQKMQPKGLGEYAEENADLKDILVYMEDVNMYAIMGTKSYRDSTEILSSDEIAQLMEVLKAEFDYIIMDTSPVALTADAEVVSELADAQLLVVRLDMAAAAAINDAIDSLSEHKAEMLGCVLNRAEAGINQMGRYGQRYGMYDYYGYRKESRGQGKKDE